MARITWDDSTKFYEYGIDRAVLYFRPGIAVPWNGIVRIEENTEPVGMEPIFFDGQLVNIQRKPQTFKARITAYVYPEMLEDLIVANGDPELVDSERNQPVHMTYRVKTPNGYQIHMLYNCVFTPQTVTTNTIGSDIDIAPFVFDVTCLPVSYGVNIYPHSGNRYDSPNYELTPPPAGSDPSAWQDYLKNKYIEDQPPTLPPFIYPDPTDFDYPHFDDHLDLDTMFPTPHFIFDDSLLDPDKWLSLEDMLYGNIDLNPSFGSPQEVFDLMLGPNPALGITFPEGFSLVGSEQTLSGYWGYGSVYATWLLPISAGTAMIVSMEDGNGDESVARCRMVGINASGELTIGSPTQIPTQWTHLTETYGQYIRRPVHLGNNKVILPMTTSVADGQPRGYMVEADPESLTVSYIGTLGAAINVGNDPYTIITDYSGRGLLIEPNNNYLTWINADGSQSGTTSGNALTQQLGNELLEGKYTHCNQDGKVVIVPDRGRIPNYNEITIWDIDFVNHVVTGKTHAAIPTLNNTYDTSNIGPGRSLGTIVLVPETGYAVFSSRIYKDEYDSFDVSSPPASPSYTGTLIEASTNSGDDFRYDNVAVASSGYVRSFNYYNSGNEKAVLVYYDPVTDYREEIELSNTGSRMYTDVAPLGNDFFLYTHENSDYNSYQVGVCKVNL